MPFDTTSQRSTAPSRIELDTQSAVLETIVRVASPTRWVKGETEVGDARCILGHLQETRAAWCTQGEAERVIDRAIIVAGFGDRLTPGVQDGLVPVAAFNDHAETTHADVLQVLATAYALASGAPT